MALVDPYSPCICGSGQKYKWCCQKVEAYAERSQRLAENGQFEAALKPLEDGLAKVPDNSWLLTRKALIELQLNQLDAAGRTLRSLVQHHPDNLGGMVLLTRLVTESEGPVEGAVQFQQALSNVRDGDRDQLASLATFVGSALGQAGFYAAALAHLELAGNLQAEARKQSASMVKSLKMNPSISAWEKNPYRLWPVPDRASGPNRESFERALEWAGQGLWSSAAAAFELLASGSVADGAADRNRGLCCLFIADHAGAVAALRRYIARTGPTPDAVDLEALCQRIDPVAPYDRVEFVHLSWPIRKRDGLLAALSGSKLFEAGEDRPLDPDDPKSQVVSRFFVLDRPQIEAKAGLARSEIPVVEGELLIGQDTVILETYDDGRLDRLLDRVTAAAGANIPPAHPRTKIIGKEQRHVLALSWRWRIPAGVSEEDGERLNNEQVAYIISEIWPATSHPALHRRTPRQAAQAGGAEVALRAAILQLQESPESWVDLVDWNKLRAQLHLKPEPAVDPGTVDIDRLPLARLAMIPIDLLDDDRILALYARSREWGIRRVLYRVAQLIDGRASLMVKGNIEAPTLYGELALDAAGRSDREQALGWMKRGMESESPMKRSAHALSWAMIEVQVQMVLDEPEVWVKSLAMILETYRGNNEATSAIFLRLINLGLVQVAPDPNNPDQVVLDTRTLEYYLNRFGPRVTTAAGELGVAAARGEIWTPASGAGSAGGKGGAIWTPGSVPAPASASGKSKIIIPG
jgi:tetratricopeptide (TPR) repeat protein